MKWGVQDEDDSPQPSSESGSADIDSEYELFVRTDSLPILVENDDTTSQSSRWMLGYRSGESQPTCQTESKLYEI